MRGFVPDFYNSFFKVKNLHNVFLIPFTKRWGQIGFSMVNYPSKRQRIFSSLLPLNSESFT